MHGPGGPPQRFLSQPRGPGHRQGDPRMGLEGWIPRQVPGNDGGAQSVNTLPWGGVSMTASCGQSFQPYVPMPPPGYGPNASCSSCCALGAELKDKRTAHEVLLQRYQTLLDEHRMCSNYKEELEKVRKERDEILKRNAYLEKEMKSIQEPAKPQLNLHPETGEKVQTSNSKSEVNEEYEKPKECVRNSKAQVKASSKSVEDSSRSKKRREKSFRPLERDLENESNFVPSEEGAKECPAVGEGIDSVRNSNRPSSKWREDHRQPKSMFTFKEIMGDLFKGTEDYSLAHCVGSDFIMSSGIAIEFRKKFRGISDLLEQNVRPGGVAFLRAVGGRFIYYLVTKQYSTGKPSWEDFTEAVRNLRKLCESHNIKQLAMPQIGCGLDHLLWSEVSAFLKDEFAGTNIEICVYWKKAEPKTEQQRWSLKLCNHASPFSEIDPRQCAIVFLGSTDGFVTPQMDELDKRFKFLHHYKDASRALGGLYMYNTGRAMLFGFLLKTSHTDDFSFSRFNECLTKLRKSMKPNGLYYIGLEAFEDPNHMIIMHKIWTLLVDFFFKDSYEVHFYWPHGVKEGWCDGWSS